MFPRVQLPCSSGPLAPARSIAVLGALALLALLAGCGSSLSARPAAHAGGALEAGSPPGCAATVLETLGGVLGHVYHEGVSSERTAVAQHLIAASATLRAAVEAGDAPAAQAAARALVASGHMTNLRVMRGKRMLANVGGPALAPLKGTLLGLRGVPIGAYLTSVWADSGFLAEGDGIAEGRIELRAGGRTVGGSLAPAPGALASAGTFRHGRDVYRYSSFAGEAFPSGRLRIYAFRSLSSVKALCGATSEETVVNTLRQVAGLIYAGETGARTRAQIRRVQESRPLLQAVARRDPQAARLAVNSLLNQHIVRLRVSAGGHLLADVGGPYVLAPVKAPLREHGRTIGNFVLSIQDDEGYLRLARRLAGLDVLMYMNTSPGHPRLVKNSLGPAPGSVPASGGYDYRGRSFRVFTLHARAFPSGELTIRVLVPIPYPV